MKPRFFRSAAGFRAWLSQHHGKRVELWVGFHKKHTEKPSITYSEALDEALCFGWIDGLRKRMDGASYTIRFTPRQPRSQWSHVNIRRARELIASRRMRAPGRAALERRLEDAATRQSARLDPTYVKKLRENRRAWAYFRAQPPGYQRTAQVWVMSAKREETRMRRLTTLIERSARGVRLAELGGPKR